MRKVLKVTIETEEYISAIENEEAQKWDQHCITLATFAENNGMNPFSYDPINWNYILKKSNLLLSSPENPHTPSSQEPTS